MELIKSVVPAITNTADKLYLKHIVVRIEGKQLKGQEQFVYFNAQNYTSIRSVGNEKKTQLFPPFPCWDILTL
jgi:hypothetical protein